MVSTLNDNKIVWLPKEDSVEPYGDVSDEDQAETDGGVVGDETDTTSFRDTFLRIADQYD